MGNKKEDGERLDLIHLTSTSICTHRTKLGGQVSDIAQLISGVFPNIRK